jgi:hypothetical protein
VFHFIEENPNLRLLGALNSAVVHLNEPKPKIDPAVASPSKEKSIKNTSIVAADPKKSNVEAPKPTAEMTKPAEQKKVSFEDSKEKQEAPKAADDGKKVEAAKKTEETKPKAEATKHDSPQEKKIEEAAVVPPKKEAEDKKPPLEPKKAEEAPKTEGINPGEVPKKPATKPLDTPNITEDLKKPQAPKDEKKPDEKKPDDAKKTAGKEGDIKAEAQPKKPDEKKPDQKNPEEKKPDEKKVEEKKKPSDSKPEEHKASRDPSKETADHRKEQKKEGKKADLNTSIEEGVPADMSESKMLGLSKSTFKPSATFTLDTSSIVEGDKKHEWKGSFCSPVLHNYVKWQSLEIFFAEFTRVMNNGKFWLALDHVVRRTGSLCSYQTLFSASTRSTCLSMETNSCSSHTTRGSSATV